MRSTIVRKGAAAVAILGLGTLLASCGGGGGGGTASGGSGIQPPNLGFGIKDAPGYPNYFYIEIQSASIIQSSGSSCTIFSQSSPISINLPSLASSISNLSQTYCPPGSYSQIVMTLSNTMGYGNSLSTLSWTTLSSGTISSDVGYASLSCSGSLCTLTISQTGSRPIASVTNTGSYIYIDITPSNPSSASPPFASISASSTTTVSAETLSPPSAMIAITGYVSSINLSSSTFMLETFNGSYYTISYSSLNSNVTNLLLHSITYAIPVSVICNVSNSICNASEIKEEVEGVYISNTIAPLSTTIVQSITNPIPIIAPIASSSSVIYVPMPTIAGTYSLASGQTIVYSSTVCDAYSCSSTAVSITTLPTSISIPSAQSVTSTTLSNGTIVSPLYPPPPASSTTTSTTTPPSSTTITSGGISYVQTYLPYINQGLYLVDPSNPMSPVPVTTLTILGYSENIVYGGYNTTNNSYTDLYVKEIDYVQASSTANMYGPLMKVSLVKNDSPPSPTQISNLTNITQIVTSWDDGINGINYMEVQTSNSQYYLVNSQMTSTDNPIPLNNMQIIDSIGGSNQPITGFLVQSGNTLEECSTSLGSSCSPVANAYPVTSVTEMATNPINGTIFLCVDGNVDELSGSTLISTGASCGSMSSFTNDNQNIYAVDSKGDILALSFSKPNAWSTLYTNNNSGSGSNSIDNMTQNYLIIYSSYYGSSYTASFIAVPKAGGLSITFYTFGGSDPGDFSLPLSNQFLFTVGNNQDLEACVWTEESSSASCTPNSYWAGEIIATSGSINYATNYPFAPYKILEVENINTTSLNGGSLYAVDPSNLSSQIFIGNIPSNYFNILGYGIGNMILLGGINIQQNYSPNILFVNLSNNTLQMLNAIGTPISF